MAVTGGDGSGVTAESLSDLPDFSDSRLGCVSLPAARTLTVCEAEPGLSTVGSEPPADGFFFFVARPLALLHTRIVGAYDRGGHRKLACLRDMRQAHRLRVQVRGYLDAARLRHLRMPLLLVKGLCLLCSRCCCSLSSCSFWVSSVTSVPSAHRLGHLRACRTSRQDARRTS